MFVQALPLSLSLPLLFLSPPLYTLYYTISHVYIYYTNMHNLSHHITSYIYYLYTSICIYVYVYTKQTISATSLKSDGMKKTQQIKNSRKFKNSKSTYNVEGYYRITWPNDFSDPHSSHWQFLESQEFWERQRAVLERLRTLAPGLEEILTGATWHVGTWDQCMATWG